MRCNKPLAALFFQNCLWALVDITGKNFFQKIPFVINEPFGPKSNGPLHLEQFDNMDYSEKPVQFNLEWEYEASTVKNDIRSINKKQIDKYASLRFVFETYNHDGWVIFG